MQEVTQAVLGNIENNWWEEATRTASANNRGDDWRFMFQSAPTFVVLCGLWVPIGVRKGAAVDRDTFFWCRKAVALVKMMLAWASASQQVLGVYEGAGNYLVMQPICAPSPTSQLLYKFV
jgi:hypothetical protein